MARVVLTQPQPRVAALASSLEAMGHEVLQLAFARMEPEWPKDIVKRVAAVDWVIAVSPTAVSFLFDALNDDWPGSAGLAVVGPGSLLALEQRALRRRPPRIESPVEAPWDAAALMRSMVFSRPEGLRCLIVRGETGREDWIDTLREREASVEVLSLYQRCPIEPSVNQTERLRAWLADRMPIHWVFTLSSSLDDCQRLLGRDFCLPRDPMDRVLTIHPRISAAAVRLGFRDVREIQPGPEGIAAALESD